MKTLGLQLVNGLEPRALFRLHTALCLPVTGCIRVQSLPHPRHSPHFPAVTLARTQGLGSSLCQQRLWAQLLPRSPARWAGRPAPPARAGVSGTATEMFPIKPGDKGRGCRLPRTILLPVRAAFLADDSDVRQEPDGSRL